MVRTNIRFHIALLLLGIAVSSDAFAQGREGRGRAGGPAAPPPTARAAAPKDFTGYWVSVVTEHWHLRMMVPPKREYAMLPLNAEARKVADAWDPAKEQGETDHCKSFGAPAIMRIPGRLYIHWADDNTLQMDIDSGTQTRMFRFNATPPPDQAPQWQGFSVAAWEGAARGRGQRLSGQLRVRTTNLRPGYLRKNGVPYGEKATVEEYFETFTEPNGDRWLLVTSIVTDPQYLTGPYATTMPFKKIADRAGWDPTPCRANEPR